MTQMGTWILNHYHGILFISICGGALYFCFLRKIVRDVRIWFVLRDWVKSNEFRLIESEPFYEMNFPDGQAYVPAAWEHRSTWDFSLEGLFGMSYDFTGDPVYTVQVEDKNGYYREGKLKFQDGWFWDSKRVFIKWDSPPIGHKMISDR